MPQVSFFADSLIRTTDAGYVAVNEAFQTNQPHIYACGDCIGKDMYAYTAEYAAQRVIAHIAGQVGPGNHLFPHCIFSIPSVAAVGMLEEHLTDKNAYLVKKMFLVEQSPAHVLADKEGFVKVIIDKNTQRIVGASILSKYASELIHMFVLAVQEEIAVSSIRRMIAVHPTISESLIRVLE
jgi:dihydrolipoamide dehydrogenase